MGGGVRGNDFERYFRWRCSTGLRGNQQQRGFHCKIRGKVEKMSTHPLTQTPTQGLGCSGRVSRGDPKIKHFPTKAFSPKSLHLKPNDRRVPTPEQREVSSTPPIPPLRVCMPVITLVYFLEAVCQGKPLQILAIRIKIKFARRFLPRDVVRFARPNTERTNRGTTVESHGSSMQGPTIRHRGFWIPGFPIGSTLATPWTAERTL